jgi:hypothetical protein
VITRQFLLTTIVCLVTALFLLMPPVACADLCFSPEVYGRMLAELEGSRIDQADIIPALTEMDQLCNRQLQSCEQSVKDCKEGLENSSAHYEEAVKEATPTFWDRIQDFGEDALIIGGIAGAVILYSMFGK